MILLAAVRPIFTARYLIPFVPGVLLALALVSLRPGRPLRSAPYLLAGVFASGVLFWAADPAMPAWRSYGWEAASSWIMERHPARLAYAWDHPAAKVIRPAAMAQAGDFFFARVGRPLPTAVFMLPASGNPNAVFSRLPRDTAVLWVYDRRLGGTAAARNPPALDTPDRECRSFGAGTTWVYACRPTAGQ